MNGQQIPPWMQRRPIVQSPPQQPYPGPMGYPRQPLQPFQGQHGAPQGQPMGFSPQPPQMGPSSGKPQKLPSEKKKKTLRILVAFLIFTTLAAIATGIYFYMTYVK